MTPRTRTAALAAATLSAAALAIAPGLASAHTSVFSVVPKVVDPSNSAALIDGPRQYLVANHGYLRVLTESNGLLDHGTENYKVLPSAWRTAPGRTKAEILAQGDTGAQPHATCLTSKLDEAAILSWQETDPFYNYVPWQKDAAGLGDDASEWIPVVKAKTGFDLATLPADPAAAAAAAKAGCEGIGGAYVPADTTQSAGSSLASGEIAKVADPLSLQVKTLTDLADGRAAQLVAEQAKTAAVRAANAAPLKVMVTSTDLRPASIAKSGLGVRLSGVAGDPIAVTVKVSAARAKKAKLPSTTIATGSAKLDASGSATLSVSLTKSAAKQLRGSKAALPLTVSAQIATSASTTATLKG